jgi:DNA-binding transcriptional LysR family regulator
MILARLPHFEDHLRPIADLLPDMPDVALVASYGDLRRARRSRFRRIVLAQHGAGQSYSNTNPHYPGGSDNGDVGLFLAPNEYAANRWRQAYPRAAVEVVGSPRLDSLPVREPGPVTACVSFHWDGYLCPETRSALPHYRNVLGELSRSVNLIGHGHPRTNLGPMYRKLGIEFVPSFDEVCRRADVYVCDNSSTIFEFAATGRPVVLLNSPAWRRDVNHGLRFWDAAHVGINVDEPGQLVGSVLEALQDDHHADREDALNLVYQPRTNAAASAATAVTDWLASNAAAA